MNETKEAKEGEEVNEAKENTTTERLDRAKGRASVSKEP
jgi:hypothetical protein